MNTIHRGDAENEGFEPSELFSSTVFKTAAIDHSANSPIIINITISFFLNTLLGILGLAPDNPSYLTLWGDTGT